MDREKLSRDKVREFSNAVTFVEGVSEFELFQLHHLLSTESDLQIVQLSVSFCWVCMFITLVSRITQRNIPIFLKGNLTFFTIHIILRFIASQNFFLGSIYIFTYLLFLFTD